MTFFFTDFVFKVHCGTWLLMVTNGLVLDHFYHIIQENKAKLDIVKKSSGFERRSSGRIVLDTYTVI